MNAKEILFLQHQALQLRIDSIRATTAAGSGHPTSCMSAADVIAALFFSQLRYDCGNPNHPNNDRFILSKGHAIPVVYAAWKHLGVITDEQLLTLRQFDSVLEGHPTPRFAYNEGATGSLGQGLAIGVGMALAARKEKLDYRTYVMMGDGEIAEGSVWEALALAAHYKLDNLVALVDCNRLGQSGESIGDHDIDSYEKKGNAFGWETIVIDGHDMEQIVNAFDTAKKNKDAPTMIIAKTYKGYGLEQTQDKENCHGKPFKQSELVGVIEALKNRFIVAASYHVDQAYVPAMPAPCHQVFASTHVPVSLPYTQATHDLLTNGGTMATRKAYGYALAALGKASKEVVVLDADVKNSTFADMFEKDFGQRFFQCFIAEQCMVGVATGMQMRGNIPFAATFGAFFSRAFDQIRMAGIGRNALRLCGSHCGVSIGQDGPSQMALEDIACMRTVPHSVVLYPSDSVSTYKLVELMANYHDGISYLRTTRADTSILYGKDEVFTLGGSKVLRYASGARACVVAAGITLHEALKAYDILKLQGIVINVIDAYSIKPLDVTTIKTIAADSNNVVITVEDHYQAGGLGEAVALGLSGTVINVQSMAVHDISRSGAPEELMKYAGIDAESIAKSVVGD
ncbi:MAG: transketolase [Candidatus Babeliales bacterium]